MGTRRSTGQRLGRVERFDTAERHHTGERLAAIVLGRDVAAVVELGERRRAEEAVLRLRADLDTAAGRAMPRRLAEAVAQATAEDARRLAAIVVDPIRHRIKDRPLVIVPTGLLATAPWAVLPGLTGRPVTVAPSATAWLTRQTRPVGPQAPKAAATEAARAAQANAAATEVASAAQAEAAATEAARAAQAEAPSAAAKEAAGATAHGRTVLIAGPGNQRAPSEIMAIARHRPGATVLTGSAATPAATLGAIDGAAVAHLAAHGRHEAQNPLFSSLELHGGPLLGYDLQRLAVPPELVVLAGCELGLSEVRPGDESFGMASALLAAGTATVVASVCRVADEVAGEAMAGLHRELVAGRSPAEALAVVGAGTGFVCLGR